MEKKTYVGVMVKCKDKIALRVGKVLNQFKVNKYYNLDHNRRRLFLSA